MRWAGHVVRVEEEEVRTGFWWGHLMERDDCKDPGVDGRIILKCKGKMKGRIYLGTGTRGRRLRLATSSIKFRD